MKIQTEGLRHIYKAPHIEERTVLDLQSLTVESDAHLLLRGISGSGKTTLLNILAGLLPPTQGQVWLGDQLLYALPEARRDWLRAHSIGYVFQSHLLVATLTAWENVEMPLVFAGKLGSAARRRQAHAILEEVGLGQFLHHRPVQLSTGQRLRVAIARALVSTPRLLLADEPTAALDEANANSVMDLIQQRCRAAGTTLVVASHDPALAGRFDRVCDLHLGRIVEQQTAPRTDTTAPAHVITAPVEVHQ